MTWKKDVDEQLDDHGKRIKDVEDDVSFFKDREAGIKLVLRGIVVALGAIAAALAIAKAIGAI